METYESVLLVKPEVFIYKIPPSGNNRRHRAANWNLAEPTWTGRMRLVTSGTQVNLKLEDKLSGVLFANCPVETYPGIAIESVSDSSRYFVIRVLGEGGRCAFLGLGFGDRSDSFDLNVALQDHFKWVKNQEQIEKDKAAPKAELDLGFKEGETIKINMKITKKGDAEGGSGAGGGRTGKLGLRPGAGAGGFLPPPPGAGGAGGAGKIAPPPAGSVRSSPLVSPAHQRAAAAGGGAEWNEFASASGGSSAATTAGATPTTTTSATTPATNSNWVQF